MTFVPGGEGVKDLLLKLGKNEEMRKRLGITAILKDFGDYTFVFKL